jgi:hypothetical protein
MMDFPMFHTTPFKTSEQRAAVAALPLEERQLMIKNLLFPYKQFNDVTEKVSRFNIPVEATGIMDTGRVGGLIGDTRAGKSRILQAYASKYPPIEVNGIVHFPVIYLEVRPEWDASEFARQIFRATGKKYVTNMKTTIVNSNAIYRVVEYGVKFIIIDDAHFIFSASAKRRESYESLIKSILDKNCCNILLAGLKSVAEGVDGNKQVKGRGGFPIFRVRPFNMKTKIGRDNFRLFLAGIDDRMPFPQSSELASTRFQADFLKISGGSVGNVMNVIQDAALKALNAGTARILDYHLRAAANDNYEDNGDDELYA